MRKISVLMPCFNNGRFLKNAVKSILDQSFREFEFIIINDGSSDNTDEIIKTFDDQRIKYVKKEHTGLADTLNYGLKIVNTDLVVRMDGDDIANTMKLEVQYKFLNRYKNYDVIGTNINIINSNNRILYRIRYPESDQEIKNQLLVNSVLPHPAVLIKRNLFDRIGYYDNIDGKIIDYDLWLRAINIGKFYNIQEFLYSYRKHNQSLTGSIKSVFSARKKTYKLMEDFVSSGRLDGIVSESQRKILNIKFLIRYSPFIEVRKIFKNNYLRCYQKFIFSSISLLPFYLRYLYFYFNPKLRLLYIFQKFKESVS